MTNEELKAENASLRAEVDGLVDYLRIASEVGIKIADDNLRLKREYERLRASSFVTAVPVEEYEKLKAEVERLRKAAIEPSQVVRLTEEGVQDVPYHYAEKYLIEVSKEAYIPFCKMMMEYWDASNAAKDGKPTE